MFDVLVLSMHEEIITNPAGESTTIVVIERADIDRSEQLIEIEAEIAYHIDKINELQGLRAQILYKDFVKETHNNTSPLSNHSPEQRNYALLTPMHIPTETSLNASESVSTTNNISRSHPTQHPTEFPTKPPTTTPSSSPTTSPTHKRTRTKKPSRSPTTSVPTMTPTFSPTQMPTIPWDSKSSKLKQTSARMIGNGFANRDQQNQEDPDEQLLRSINPDIVKIYILQNFTSNTFRNLELELLNNPSNDLVLTTGYVPEQKQCRLAEQYYTRIDFAFMLAMEFLKVLHNHKDLVTDDRDYIEKWVTHCSQMLIQINSTAFTTELFYRLNTTKWTKTNETLQYKNVLNYIKYKYELALYEYNKEIFQGNREWTSGTHYDIVIEVFFEYFGTFMDLVTRHKLVNMERDQYDDRIKTFHKGLSIFMKQLTQWHMQHDANDSSRWTSVQAICVNMYNWCLGVSVHKAENDIATLIKKWKDSDGYGVVSVATRFAPTLTWIDVMRSKHVGYTGKIQLWDAVYLYDAEKFQFSQRLDPDETVNKDIADPALGQKKGKLKKSKKKKL